ncbi:nucleotidyl transferase AbiEii/AbiGii toxin family protein [Patescibacteria group bacterium AH-259-L05]|nr:nucleotidyl transferase AbiEii/AbiGii toxin family protein [Patescibacteria group bacterium AH-259-L05]
MALNIPKHKNILFKILKDIYYDTTISPFLGFKGGTAAYIFYGLPRFSIDLDFDLLDETKEEYVFLRVKQIVKKYGQIKDARKKRFNLFFLLSYEEKAQNIKIEINRRPFGSQYELKTHLGVSILVMKKEYMSANKLVAMYERLGRSNRDIYDIWFFLEKNWPINKELVQGRVNKPFKSFLKECIDVLKKFDDRDILAGMGELLDAKQKIWAKKHLKKDVLFLFRLYLSNLA